MAIKIIFGTPRQSKLIRDLSCRHAVFSFQEPSANPGACDLTISEPDFCRPSGTCLPSCLNPALKRWAIVGCPFGTNACLNSRKALRLIEVNRNRPRNHTRKFYSPSLAQPPARKRLRLRVRLRIRRIRTGPPVHGPRCASNVGGPMREVRFGGILTPMVGEKFSHAASNRRGIFYAEARRLPDCR
jgi:hypothetical protein